MALRRINHIVLILSTVLLNVGCDQVSKSIVRQRLDYEENIEMMHGHFRLTKIENTGAFLSLGESLPAPFKNLLLSFIPLLALLAALIFLLRKRNIDPGLLLGICFVTGGGIGNVLDRILYGSVTDFLYIDFGIFETGIFNIADVSVMTGTFIILMHSLFRKTNAGLR